MFNNFYLFFFEREKISLLPKGNVFDIFVVKYN